MQSIEHWFTFDYATSSSDIFHTCFSEPAFQPPLTWAGNSAPHSGEAMAGIGMTQSTGHREVISVKLEQPLIKDSAYCVNFWLRNSLGGNYYYWTQNIGGFFTEDTIEEYQLFQLSAELKPAVKLDQQEWVSINGYLIATGDEKYFNIGFFGNGDHYHSGNAPADVFYYFLDDVSVTPCNKDSLLAVICEFPNVFSPDGNAVNDLYTLQLRNIKKLNIQIFNRWGNVVREYDGVTDTWDGTDQHGEPLSEGVYFVKALAETNFGELIPKYQYVHLVR